MHSFSGSLSNPRRNPPLEQYLKEYKVYTRESGQPIDPPMSWKDFADQYPTEALHKLLGHITLIHTTLARKNDGRVFKFNDKKGNEPLVLGWNEEQFKDALLKIQELLRSLLQKGADPSKVVHGSVNSYAQVDSDGMTDSGLGGWYLLSSYYGDGYKKSAYDLAKDLIIDEDHIRELNAQGYPIKQFTEVLAESLNTRPQGTAPAKSISEILPEHITRTFAPTATGRKE